MPSSAPRVAPLFAAAPPRRYGLARRALLVVCVLFGTVAFAAAANYASRHALWQVVRACTLDKATTGAPLPCLEVDISKGEDRGYAVLRPPLGAPDTILTPTRRILGLEDPTLQAPDAPNYFAFAWAARRWLAKADGSTPTDERIALAVNSKQARSQDQLHVHIGCLAPSFERELDAWALASTPGVWRHAGDIGPGLEFWTYRSGTLDWTGLDPFRLAAEQFGGAEGLARVTLAVAPKRDEFIVFALRSRGKGWYAAAEDVMDVRCR